jgi:hypothetical protein
MKAKHTFRIARQQIEYIPKKVMKLNSRSGGKQYKFGLYIAPKYTAVIEKNMDASKISVTMGERTRIYEEWRRRK